MTVQYRNDNATFGQLLEEIQKPGAVFVAMLGRDDVRHVKVVKSDLVNELSDAPRDDESGQSFMRWKETGALYIDGAY